MLKNENKSLIPKNSDDRRELEISSNDKEKDKKTYNEYERHRKRKDKKKYNEANCWGKLKIKLEEIDREKGIFNIVKVIVSISVIITIFVTTYQSIKQIKDQLKDLSNKNTLLQENLNSATNTILLIQTDMNNFLQQLATQNETITNLQLREQEVVSVLNSLNLTYISQEVNYTIEIVNIYDKKVQNLQLMLENDVIYIDRIYNSTIDNMSSQANSTLYSLQELNYTLWEKSYDIDITLNNIQKNMTAFESNILNNIKDFQQQITNITTQLQTIGKGVTDGSNAPTGYVGEFITSTVTLSPGVPLISGYASDVTSISLTAGDWDVWGSVTFFGGSTTVFIVGEAWINTLSETKPDPTLYNSLIYSSAETPFVQAPTGFNVPLQRLSLSGNQTVYLSGITSFTTSTCIIGGTISARRRR